MRWSRRDRAAPSCGWWSSDSFSELTQRRAYPPELELHSPHLCRCPLLASTRPGGSDSRSDTIHLWTLCDPHPPPSASWGTGGSRYQRRNITKGGHRPPHLFPMVGRHLYPGGGPGSLLTLPLWVLHSKLFFALIAFDIPLKRGRWNNEP